MTKVTVTVSGTPIDYTFAYDALGRRESMTSGGTTTEYLYQGLKVLVEKTGALTKRYTNGPQAVGGIISKDDGTDTTYYHYDAIGNVLLTSDGDGYVDETFVQDAYGNVIAGTASGYHLTTKEYFPAFGLYYFNARWYDPEIGRFVSRAPFNFDVEHPYVYVHNRPLKRIDPTGEKDTTQCNISPIGGGNTTSNDCEEWPKIDYALNDSDKCKKIADKIPDASIRACVKKICDGKGKKTQINCRRNNTRNCSGGREGHTTTGASGVSLCVDNINNYCHTKIVAVLVWELSRRCGGKPEDMFGIAVGSQLVECDE